MDAKTLRLKDLQWLPVLGSWNPEGTSLNFRGGEVEQITEDESGNAFPDRMLQIGQLVFSQRFVEGEISVEIEFENPDYRSIAEICLQVDVSSSDMLNFGVGGGGRRPETGAGPLYGLRRWGAPLAGLGNSQPSSTVQNKIFTNLFVGGDAINLVSGKTYTIRVKVQGSVITGYVNHIEVMKYSISQTSLPGLQIGLFCLSRERVKFHNLSVSPQMPQAFVVMQFNTPEYESLYTDVIEPICREEGISTYRGDSTYMPGLIINDIKQRIEESRIIIAEITPSNANVYYEVGYADALKKPIILIADKKEGQKPFDVRAYRTIFYENSISGKRKVEEDLRKYLHSISNLS